MTSVPLVSACWVRPVIHFLQEQGIAVSQYLQDFKLPEDITHGSHTPCPQRSVRLMVDRVARDAGIRNIGVRVGERTRIRTLGCLGCSVSRATTLREAIRVAQATLPAVYNTRSFTLLCDGPKARLFSQSSDPFTAGNTWEDQFMLLMTIDLVRMAAGPNWRPEHVALKTGDFEGRRDCAILASTTVHQSENATMVEFPRVLLDRPFVESSLRVLEFRCPQQKLDSSPLPQDLAGSLQSVLELLVPQSFTDITSAAEVIGTSRRTLQRHLSECGHTFSSLLRRARLELATRMLSDPSVKLIEIAFELGYTDPSHFSKAFRRWTGSNPRKYRRSRTHPFEQSFKPAVGTRPIGPILPVEHGRNARVGSGGVI